MTDQPEQLIAVHLTNFISIVQEFIPPLQKIGWCYRGHSKTSYELKPKAGREELFDSSWEIKQLKNPNYPDKDLGRFKTWRDEAIAFTDELPKNDLECLALAQHYGLATRLLDWTRNPLVALFFACKEHADFDGCVFGYLPDLFIINSDTSLDKIDRLVCYQPRPFNQRIHNQKGIFTYHPQLEVALEKKRVSDDLKKLSKSGNNLERILIPKESKGLILRELFEFGIDESFLFPGLDGLSSSINWGTRRDADKL